MPKKNIILNLPGFTVQNMTGYDPVIFNVKYNRKAKCPHCGGKNLRKKDTFMRQVRHEMLGEKQTILRFKAHKFCCRSCGRYFNQCFPGILKYQRATERLKQQLCRQHSFGICQKTLSGIFKFGKALLSVGIIAIIGWPIKRSLITNVLVS